MDILTYIDRVKANYSKQPEPVYNTQKYFTGGSVTKPKRGLVDEPGSYSQDDELGRYIHKKTVNGKPIYELEVRKQIEGKRKTIKRKKLPRTEDNLKILKNIRDTDPKLAKYIKPALYADDDYLKLRLENSNKNQKQFADFLNKETDFRPVNGGKFKEGTIKNMDNSTKYISQTKFRIPENTRANIIKDFKTGKYSMMALGRKYFPDDPVDSKIKGQRVQYTLQKEGLDTSLFKPKQINSNKSKYESQYKRKREITKLLKKAGKKTKEQYFTLENQILAGNEEILKLSDDEILSNKKIMNALNIDASKDNLAKGKITFDKYKNLSPEEQVAKVRELAEKRLFIQPEHIRSVYTGQQNIVYPNNLQSAPGKIGSYMENIKEYVRKNPDGKAIPEIEKLFKDYDMGVDEGGKKVGFKNIEYNSKKGASNIVDRGLFKVLGKKANIKNLIASISSDPKCQGMFNEGGSTNLDFCFREGQKAINSGKIAKGAQGRNLSKLLNSVLTKSGTGLRAVMKFGIIPEALFLGAESLIRLGMGDTLDEAITRSTGYFRPGDQTREADTSMLTRLIGPENAKTALRVRDYEQSLNNLSSAKQKRDSNQSVLSEDPYSYTSNVDSTKQLEIDNERVKQAERDLIFKFRPEAERDQAARLELEAADRFGTKSVFKKFKENAKKQNVDDDDFEQISAPEITQKDLNKRMGDPVYSIDDIANSNITDEILNDIRKQYKNPNITKQQIFKEIRKNPNFNKNIFKGLFEEARKNSSNQEQLFGASGKFFGDSILNPQKEGMDRMRKLMNIPGVKGVADMATGGIANLTRTIAPKKGPQSEGLAYFMKNGKK